MKRKLPPDSEVWALHASGMTYAQIGERFGCAISSVQYAMDRWTDKPITHKKKIAATTKDRSFITAGSQPVVHRDTGDGGNAVTLELDGVFRRSFLQLHECSDLLREWGVA